MPLATFNNAHHLNREEVGWSLTALGGPLFIANINSQALNTPVDGVAADPWALAAGSPDAFATNHANVRPFIVPDAGMYLNLWHIWRSNLTIAAAPRIQVFGLLPRPQEDIPGARQFPYDNDSAFPNTGKDHWVLLEDPDDSNIYLEFGTAIACRYQAAMWQSKKRTVYLQGASKVLVAVIRAASFSSGGTTSSSSGDDQSYGLIGAQISG